MNIGEKITEIKESKNTLNKKLKVLKIMQKNEDSFPNRCAIFINFNEILINFEDFKQFKQIIQWLKLCFGKIKYTRSTTWYSSGWMLCSWKIEGQPVEVWLQTPPEDFPKELQSETCKVVKLDPILEEQYAYVCTKEG